MMQKSRTKPHGVLSMIAAVILISLGYSAAAVEPSCSTAGSVSFCRYTGAVAKIYVNDANQILLYFDTPMDVSRPAAVGISGVTQSVAAIIRINDNPTFAQYFYSTALAAQARGVDINIQMRGVSNGYLKIDRVSVEE